jgi:hypothetical protein
MERVDEMTAPPVVGQYYWVPTVVAQWHRSFGVWPVIGPAHAEDRCVNFPHTHYHFDLRFLPQRHYARHALVRLLGSPLQSHNEGGGMNHDGLPKPALRRRKMLRELPHPHPFLAPDLDSARTARQFPLCLQAEYAGRPWATDAAGRPVCPHKGAPLGGVPVIGGVVTCPLHGLRFRDGVVFDVTEGALK